MALVHMKLSKSSVWTIQNLVNCTVVVNQPWWAAGTKFVRCTTMQTMSISMLVCFLNSICPALKSAQLRLILTSNFEKKNHFSNHFVKSCFSELNLGMYNCRTVYCSTKGWSLLAREQWCPYWFSASRDQEHRSRQGHVHCFRGNGPSPAKSLFECQCQLWRI